MEREELTGVNTRPFSIQFSTIGCPWVQQQPITGDQTNVYSVEVRKTECYCHGINTFVMQISWFAFYIDPKPVSFPFISIFVDCNIHLQVIQVITTQICATKLQPEHLPDFSFFSPTRNCYILSSAFRRPKIAGNYLDGKRFIQGAIVKIALITAPFTQA